MSPRQRKKTASPKKSTSPLEVRIQSLENRLDKWMAQMAAALPRAAEPVSGPRAAGALSALGWLSASEFEMLAGKCRLMKVPAGQILFAEGDEGSELYLLQEGLLEIYKKDFLGDLRIAEIKPGGIVGEMALIEGKPRSANVRAIQDSKVLALTRAKYEQFKEQHPAVATKLQDELLKMFSIRLRQTTEKMMGRV